jgi:hypothetical protein
MLTLRHKLEIAGAVLALLIIGVVYRAWLADHEERIKLAATLEAQKQVMAEVDKRETVRADALKQSLAELEDLKKRTQTPAQVVRALPNVIPLQQPITLNLPAAVAASDPTKAGLKPDAPVPQTATIPAADLKPLFDFAATCKECQAKVLTLQQDKADDAVKIGALVKQRDAAVIVAKGGTKWQRIKKAAMYLGIGTAVGYAAKAAH